jgi:hypothetical protein
MYARFPNTILLQYELVAKRLVGMMMYFVG